MHWQHKIQNNIDDLLLCYKIGLQHYSQLLEVFQMLFGDDNLLDLSLIEDQKMDS